MTYLIDTDWVVDSLKGRVDAVQLLSSFGMGSYCYQPNNLTETSSKEFTLALTLICMREISIDFFVK